MTFLLGYVSTPYGGLADNSESEDPAPPAQPRKSSIVKILNPPVADTFRRVQDSRHNPYPHDDACGEKEEAADGRTEEDGYDGDPNAEYPKGHSLDPSHRLEYAEVVSHL